MKEELGLGFRVRNLGEGYGGRMGRGFVTKAMERALGGKGFNFESFDYPIRLRSGLKANSGQA